MSGDHEAEITQPQQQGHGTESIVNEKAAFTEASEKALGPTPDGEEPNAEEVATLRHVAEHLPISAWLVAVVELCERFTYYGMSGMFQNYVDRPLDGSEGRGALGMGHQGATGLTTFFQFWCYVTPIIGAIVADQYLGKYKTIVVFCIIYLVGLLILVCTSIPTALHHGAGVGGFIVSILIIGLGTGGIKSNVAPLIADQYKRKKMAMSTTKKGERAGQMEGHGIPNDLMQNFDPISIIVFIPVLETLVYPLLRRLRIRFRPITRISLGFVVASLAMMYAAIVQHLIYSAGPCYEHPGCAASEVDGSTTGNHVHIAIQTPAYVFIGLSEIFASVSGLEYAYTKAPPSMKSFVQSMYLLTNAFGSALAEALTPAAYDPAIMWMFVGLACASFVAGIIFWLVYHHLNDQEDQLNALDADDPDAPAAPPAYKEKKEQEH
ncbi:MFS peptide transporter Ptr2 [Aspergillus luchuensis]|uniref:MFS peptide transporter Ptr2 n=1 Tax=Aspergillus kawachii TaxID=1069201 RepID=A0A146EY66_ASPKA|nr:MFS peptide transporter Ptr2 [Aspergillus luchuensis]